jgi:hypothetical protein
MSAWATFFSEYTTSRYVYSVLPSGRSMYSGGYLS